jgi:AraC-like DNA-binding protein
MNKGIHEYKYITVSDEDRRNGIFLLGAGHTEVIREIEYPLIDHPVHHYFHWSQGRRLSEYQILYITSGKGIFESEVSGKQEVKTGDLFILYPNIWHRFSPDKKTGWNEYWIEFNGELINFFRKDNFLDEKKPVISVGLDDDIMDGFLKVISIIKEEEITLQFSASAILFQILMKVFSYKKFHLTDKHDVERKIKEAKLIIIERMDQLIYSEKIAEKIGMGYSLFRKEFKRYTGFSPVQYQIQLRIQKSKTLLSTTNLPVKEIAHQLGFESNNYFSRVFKQKSGISPVDFRLRNKR